MGAGLEEDPLRRWSPSVGAEAHPGLDDLLAQVVLVVVVDDPREVAASVRIVRGPEKMFDGAYTTGELGGPIIEQSLVLESPQGLVLLTGCAHPGIAEIVRAATRQRQRPAAARREAHVRAAARRVPPPPEPAP